MAHARVPGDVKRDIGGMKAPHDVLRAWLTGTRDRCVSRLSHNSIRATDKLNGLNNPKIIIDRQSGHIRLEGLETFDGECNAVDPDAKKF